MFIFNFDLFLIYQVTVNLTFTEAARGSNKDAYVNVVDVCPKCRGSKCDFGMNPSKCYVCHGTGKETVTNGPVIFSATCRYCTGSGVHIGHPCINCDAIGAIVRFLSYSYYKILSKFKNCFPFAFALNIAK